MGEGGRLRFSTDSGAAGWEDCYTAPALWYWDASEEGGRISAPGVPAPFEDEPSIGKDPGTDRGSLGTAHGTSKRERVRTESIELGEGSGDSECELSSGA